MFWAVGYILVPNKSACYVGMFRKFINCTSMCIKFFFFFLN